MIDREKFVNINLLKKETFTGSLNGMRYRLRKNVTEEETPKTTLIATIWPQPYNFEKTADELKISQEFEFTKEGVKAAADWLNSSYIEKKDMWKDACMWKVLKD